MRVNNICICVSPVGGLPIKARCQATPANHSFHMCYPELYSLSLYLKPNLVKGGFGKGWGKRRSVRVCRWFWWQQTNYQLCRDPGGLAT